VYEGWGPHGGGVVYVYARFGDDESASSYFVGVGDGRIMVGSAFACIEGEDTAYRQLGYTIRPEA
jgi:hypothetical protein